MNSPALIVCERAGAWTAALRQSLRRPSEPAPFAVRHVRQTHEVDRELAAAPGSVAALEVTLQNFARTLEWLADLRRRDRWARGIALVTPEVAAQRAILAEAGAWRTIAAPREAELVADFIRWHVGRMPHSALSETDRIWKSLPWNETL